MPTPIDTATTRMVRRITVSRVGQATFLSSLQLSTRYRRMPVSTIGSIFLLRGGGRYGVRRWQGRQDSNLQPLVLETSALPIELHPSGARAASYLVSRCS